MDIKKASQMMTSIVSILSNRKKNCWWKFLELLVRAAIQLHYTSIITAPPRSMLSSWMTAIKKKTSLESEMGWRERIVGDFSHSQLFLVLHWPAAVSVSRYYAMLMRFCWRVWWKSIEIPQQIEMSGEGEFRRWSRDLEGFFLLL